MRPRRRHSLNYVCPRRMAQSLSQQILALLTKSPSFAHHQTCLLGMMDTSDRPENLFRQCLPIYRICTATCPSTRHGCNTSGNPGKSSWTHCRHVAEASPGFHSHREDGRGFPRRFHESSVVHPDDRSDAALHLVLRCRGSRRPNFRR